MCERWAANLVLVGGTIALGVCVAGCGSVYHDVARREPGGIEQRLDLRRAQALDLHEQTLDAAEQVLADLREQRRTRTRAGRIERMRDERVAAEQLAWRARKSIASIEDVIVLDAEGRISPDLGRASARQMTALEAASDEIGGALERVREAIDAFASESPELAELLDRIAEQLTRARGQVDAAGS